MFVTIGQLLEVVFVCLTLIDPNPDFTDQPLIDPGYPTSVTLPLEGIVIVTVIIIISLKHEYFNIL